MKKQRILKTIIFVFSILLNVYNVNAMLPETGCTDPAATNYNSYATEDDGSCVYSDTTNTDTTNTEIYGCMDSTATNYNQYATVDDNSCVYSNDTTSTDSTNTEIYGCIDSTATNYNPLANIDNGNCIYTQYTYGCTDIDAINYDSIANINDGSCIFTEEIWGCTDSSATNFNIEATIDDGYCEYATIIYGCTDISATNYNPQANIDNGKCIFDTLITTGCTDPFALNYNEFATQDNGSCIYNTVNDTISGCMDTDALNYNPVATISNNSSCIYASAIVPGCTSPMALNYNTNATIDDSSCVFARPVNIIINNPNNISNIIDTIGCLPQNNCSFDFSNRPDSVTINSITQTQGTEYNVEWNIWQNGTSTTVNSTYTINSEGEIMLYLSIICNGTTLKSQGNEKVKALTISSPVNVEDPTNTISILNKDISIYPIPTDNKITLSIGEKGANNYLVNIYSIDGKTMMTKEITTTKGENNFTFNCNSYESGIYFLNIKTKNNQIIYSTKIIKE